MRTSFGSLLPVLLGLTLPAGVEAETNRTDNNADLAMIPGYADSWCVRVVYHYQPEGRPLSEWMGPSNRLLHL